MRISSMKGTKNAVREGEVFMRGPISFGRFVMRLEKYLSLIFYPRCSYDLRALLPDKPATNHGGSATLYGGGKPVARRGRPERDFPG